MNKPKIANHKERIEILARVIHEVEINDICKIENTDRTGIVGYFDCQKIARAIIDKFDKSRI